MRKPAGRTLAFCVMYLPRCRRARPPPGAWSCRHSGAPGLPNGSARGTMSLSAASGGPRHALRPFADRDPALSPARLLPAPPTSYDDASAGLSSSPPVWFRTTSSPRHRSSPPLSPSWCPFPRASSPTQPTDDQRCGWVEWCGVLCMGGWCVMGLPGQRSHGAAVWRKSPAGRMELPMSRHPGQPKSAPCGTKDRSASRLVILFGLLLAVEHRCQARLVDMFAASAAVGRRKGSFLKRTLSRTHLLVLPPAEPDIVAAWICILVIFVTTPPSGESPHPRATQRFDPPPTPLRSDLVPSFAFEHDVCQCLGCGGSPLLGVGQGRAGGSPPLVFPRVGTSACAPEVWCAPLLSEVSSTIRWGPLRR